MNCTTGGVPCSVSGESAGSVAGLKVAVGKEEVEAVRRIRNKAIR
jgi:hypothetical protein